MIEVLKNDYNIEAAERVKPKGDNFEMYVTPRFAPTYACGYEQLSTRLVSVLSAQIDIFVDVGAHYGYYSMLVGSTNEDAQIIAVEPVLANLELLKRNFEYNNISVERYCIVHAAVSDSNGVTNFYISEASDNCSIYPHPSSETLDEIFVAKVPLDELIPRTSSRKILIKTDTDGHEIEVLKGLELTSKFHHDVMILMEINPKMLAIAHRSVEEIFDWLDAQGYRVFAVDEEDQCFYPLDHRVNREVINRIYEKSYYNVVCIKKEKTLSLALFSHTAGLDGAGRSLFDLAKGFISRGVICNVVVPSHGLLAEELKTIGCGVLVAPEPLRRVWQWALFDKEDISYQFSPELSHSIQEFLLKIKKIQPDYIISQTITSPWGAVFAELLSIPHALSVREYGVHDHDLNFIFGFQEALSAFYQSSDIVFCITNDVKDKLFNADPLGKCEIIYSAIELKDNHKLEEINIDAYFSNINGPVFCMPAFLHPGKGQLDLVNSVIDIRKKGVAAKCLLVGSVADEAYAAQVFRCINDSGYSESFVYLEFTSEIHALLRQVDCVVSCSRFEALGRTLIEASLLEKPIIYANSGGPKEVFQDEVHGLAYSPGNLLELSECMLRLINDPVAAVQRARTAKLMCEQRFNDHYYSEKALKKLKINNSDNYKRFSLSKSVLKLLFKEEIDFIEDFFWSPLFCWSSDGRNISAQNQLLFNKIEFGLFDCCVELKSNYCKSLKFYPIVNQFVSIDSFSIEAYNDLGRKLQEKEINITTESLESGRHWVFASTNPQVNMTFAQPVSTVRIWGDIRPVSIYMFLSRVASLEQALIVRNEEVADLLQAVAERDLRISNLNAQLAEILRSKSWFLTKPFRDMRSALRSSSSKWLQNMLAKCL